MTAALSAFFVAVVVFASTDLDNLLVMTVFFADPGMQARAVVAGQFLGIGVLVLVSVLSGLLALTIPPAWIALLGVIPLCLGVRGFVRLWRKRRDAGVESKREQQLQAKMHSQVLAVMLVAMGHGADNLGVYIPLFARTPEMIPFYILGFAIMTGISCLIAHRLVRNQLLGGKIRRYGRLVMPFVLMGLGVEILWGARGLIGY